MGEGEGSKMTPKIGYHLWMTPEKKKDIQAKFNLTWDSGPSLGLHLGYKRVFHTTHREGAIQLASQRAVQMTFFEKGTKETILSVHIKIQNLDFFSRTASNLKCF